MSDYGIPVPSQLVFVAGLSTHCTDITTTDDVVYETTESFTVELSSTSGNVDVSGSVATVLITDNDGMHYRDSHVFQNAKQLLLQGSQSDFCSQVMSLQREILPEYASML